jgi:hypothetical protein
MCAAAALTVNQAACPDVDGGIVKAEAPVILVSGPTAGPLKVDLGQKA